MTRRAERLARYLEEEVGIGVFSDLYVCPNRLILNWSHRYVEREVPGYCSDCGTRLVPDDSRAETLEQLEAAIGYALEEGR